MKNKDIKDLTVGHIGPINLENIFNVYIDNDMLDDQYYYNITKTVVIPPNLDETNYFDYTVMGGETWPLLAFRFYGDIRAWWLICVTNDIQDPTSFPAGNTVLKILHRNVARQILTTIGNT